MGAELELPLQALPWMQAVTKQVLTLWRQKQLAHAICLQTGVGFGQRHQLQLLAQLLFCEAVTSENHPCFSCKQCQLMGNGEHPDFLSVESISEKSDRIGIGQVRTVHEFIATTAYFAPMRLVVIDGIERMTLAASNALLKHLEEPPSNVYFLLSSTKTSQLMPTIRSRIQFFPVAPPSFQIFLRWVREFLHEAMQEQELDEDQIKLCFEIAQSGPFLGLTCAARALGLKKLPKGLLVYYSDKETHLLAHYSRLLEVMSQPLPAAKMHLGVMVKELNLEQSSILFELWLQRELLKLKTDTSRGQHHIDRLYTSLNQIYGIRHEVALSPQLNPTHLKRRLLKAWFSCKLA